MNDSVSSIIVKKFAENCKNFMLISSTYMIKMLQLLTQFSKYLDYYSKQIEEASDRIFNELSQGTFIYSESLLTFSSIFTKWQ